MQELINKLQSAHGLSAEQSKGILGTITNYIKEKFPMVSGAIDNLFQDGAPTATTAAPGTAPTNNAPVDQNDGSILDKISDYVPGATGQKIEDFAKGAKDKIDGFFKKDDTPNS